MRHRNRRQVQHTIRPSLNPGRFIVGLKGHPFAAVLVEAQHILLGVRHWLDVGWVQAGIILPLCFGQRQLLFSGQRIPVDVLILPPIGKSSDRPSRYRSC